MQLKLKYHRANHLELSTQCSLAGMRNKTTGMIVEESLVLVAGVHPLHMAPWVLGDH